MRIIYFVIAILIAARKAACTPAGDTADVLAEVWRELCPQTP